MMAHAAANSTCIGKKTGIRGGRRQSSSIVRTVAVAVVACLFALPEGHADDRFPPYDNTEDVKAAWAARPDFYHFKTPADLPPDLVWESGGDYPEMGDPEAKKGGTLHLEMPDFPPTLRFFGPDGNNTFRGEHADNIEMTLVDKQINIDKWFPCIAEAWAVGADRKEVFFRLDPAATYSDGVKITVEDFFMYYYVAMSPHVKDPYMNQFIPQTYAGITKYDDRTFSITLKDLTPDPVYKANMSPLPRHFFREFTDDFPARYQWRKMPTTGAYDIKQEDVKLGRSITLSRVKDWWAKDRKHYRYRFNPDRIEYRRIGSADLAFEMFRQGKIDIFSTSRFIVVPPVYWYDKAEIPEILNGYIERYKFFNQYPRISRALYINQSKPFLDNVDVRLGVSHATNFDKVIAVVLRGDATRMNSVFAGYGRYTNPALKAKPYDVAKAQEHFAKAGFTKRDRDGVLMNSEGKRLSFKLSVGNQALYNQMALILKEDALKAGLEFRIESLDFTQLFKMGDQKTHEIILAGFGATPPYPRPWEYLHSDNAWEKLPDGTRKPKIDTNNFCMNANPEMDKLIDQQRIAPTEDEMQRLSWQIEMMAEELACTVPTWDTPFYRYLHWRWIRWPKDGNLKQTREAHQANVLWIDEDIKEETKQAMKDGKSFGEVSRVFDQYEER